VASEIIEVINIHAEIRRTFFAVPYFGQQMMGLVLVTT
jgi:hypothetical protein